MYVTHVLLIFFLIYILTSYFVQCQNCTRQDFDATNNCSANAFVTFQSNVKDKREEIVTKVLQCFVDNHCLEDNSTNWDDDDTIWRFFGNIDPTLFRKCQINVTVPLAHNIEICVRQTYEGFTMIKMVTSIDGHAFSGNSDDLQKIMTYMSKCSAENLSHVMMCIKSATVELKHTLGVLCQTLSSCKKKLPCKYESVKAAVCNCTRENLDMTTGASDKYINQFFSCVGLNKPNLRRRLELSIFINQVINEFCDHDLCAQYDGNGTSLYPHSL